MDTGPRSRPARRVPRRLPRLCAALLLSSPAARAFAPDASAKPAPAPRSSVVRRYRVESESPEDASGRQSDAYSALPRRLSSSVGRLDGPSEFRSRVLGETDSLVVVRFYAEICPSCRATRPLFRRWSRDVETRSGDYLPIKILEMPLSRANSDFLADQLGVDRLPYYHLYHPEFGLVEEQLALNKMEFGEFVNVVDDWSSGGREADFKSSGQPDNIDCEAECGSPNDYECGDLCNVDLDRL